MSTYVEGTTAKRRGSCPPCIRTLPVHATLLIQVAGFSAGFLAFARVALPLRAAVALALTPALDKYIVRPLVEKGVLTEGKDQVES